MAWVRVLERTTLLVNIMQAPKETIVSPIITENFGKDAAVPRGITETALEESPSQHSLLLLLLWVVVEVEVQV